MKNFKRSLSVLSTALLAASPALSPAAAVFAEETAAVQECSIIPLPVSYTALDDSFTFTPDSAIVIDAEGLSAEDLDEALMYADYASEKLSTATGYDFPVELGSDQDGNLLLVISEEDTDLGDEGYRLVSGSTGVKITANQPGGLFNGVQSLRQMLPADIDKSYVVEGVEWTVPGAEIYDKPEYSYRGQHIDPARHFISKERIMRQIDLLSSYKINTLHMHLADDQGWRIEIKGELYGESLDKLRTIGASRSGSANGYAPGQYTQEDFKEIVEYAASRHVEIIPEIDMPAHAWAALVSLNFLNSTEDGLPHASKRGGGEYDNTQPYDGMDVGFASLECRNEKTYVFIEEVIKQISAISPSPYFHIGGDEANVTPHEDYVYFMNRIAEITKKYGKIPFAWQNFDAAVEESEGTVTQFWSTGNAKMKEGINYVASPADHAYLDMQYDRNSEFGLSWAGRINLQKAYEWDPTDYGTKDQVVGVEGCLWHETLNSDYAVDYMMYPRASEIAEIGWTPKEQRSFADWSRRAAADRDRLLNKGVNLRIDPTIWQTPEEQNPLEKALLKTAIDYAQIIADSETFEKLAPAVQTLIITALDHANTVYSDVLAAKDNVFSAWKKLSTAVHYASFLADKADLQALVDECDGLTLEGFTPEELASYQEALNNAKDVLADENALQERIDRTLQELLAAKNALTSIPADEADKYLLGLLIAAGDEALANDDLYVKNDAWTTFTDALTSAKTVYDSDEASAVEVKGAVTALSSAYLSLRLVPSEELLAQLKDFAAYCDGLDLSAFAAADAARIEKASAKAKAMYTSKDFTEEEFNIFAQEMRAVYDLKPNSTPAARIEPAGSSTSADMIEPAGSDNAADIKADVNNSVKTDSVNTAAASHAGLFGLIAAGSAAAAAWFVSRKKRR